MPEVYELGSTTDVAGIKYALQQIVSRHEVLRSTIERSDEGGYGLQQVHEEPLPIEEITLTEKDDHKAIIKEDINHPFDLCSAYPMRVKFYFILPEESGDSGSRTRTLLLINIHHIASDGWSTDIFRGELFAYYTAWVNKDTEFSLPALDIQYKDYAAWQRKYLAGSVLADQLRYWKEKLSGY